MNQTLSLSTGSSVSIQQTLRPVLPVIKGCKEYRDQETLILKIDRLLKVGGIEELFLKLSLEEDEAKALVSGKHRNEWQRRIFAQHSISALRCVILRHLLGGSLREMSRRMAECQLFQMFCRLTDFERAHIPNRSVLQRYEHWLPQEKMAQILEQVTQVLSDETKAHEIGLRDAIKMEMVTVDTTCLEANIHFPVDWILLRDAVRTLMKATATIRKHGLKKRMLESSNFISRISSHCMAMSGARRKKDSKKQRKATLRAMKTLVDVVKNHALRHRDYLDQAWEQTDLSRAQVDVILARIDSILKQLPEAKRQAHERIIGERQVPTHKKILSLYESDLHVITRGKAGAEVEFGNTLFLATQELGYIFDHQLLQDTSPGDAQLLLKRYEQINKASKGHIASISADRGFDSTATRQLLQEKNVFNVLCPRNPVELAKRLKEEPKFKKLLKKRSKVESRISILKHVFLWNTPKAKGYEHRAMQVTWAVLAHNLWIMARRGRWKEDELAPLAA